MLLANDTVFIISAIYIQNEWLTEQGEEFQWKLYIILDITTTKSVIVLF